MFPALFIYVFIFWERERGWAEAEGEAVGEGEKESLKQAPYPAWSPTWGLISWPWDHDWSPNQESDA